MKYLIVNATGELISSTLPKKSDDYFVLNTEDNTIYPLSIYDILEVDDHTVRIGTQELKRDIIKIIDYEEQEEYTKDGVEGLIVKDIDDAIKDPYTNKYMPFTNSVAIIIKKKGKNLEKAFNKQQFTKKRALIRAINEVANTDKELTIKKCEELLKFYDLTILDLIKDEYKG